MSRQDQLTKRKGMVANNVSHSKRRTKTKKELNLKTKRFVVGGKKLKLRITSKTIKIIRKTGLLKALKKYKKK